jgi:hypothetical protein
MPTPDKDRPLAPAELATARQALAAARGRRRLDLLLDARDPAALVRALPAEELYLTIREIGLADAAPLVPLASAEQFRAFLDLDAWTGDRFEAHRALPWLRAGRVGAHLDPRSAARWSRKRAALDRELVFLLLRETLVVHDLEQDPDPELSTDRFLRTPEGKFLVEFAVEGAEYVAVRGLLDDLYADDPFQASRLISSIRWDLPSELEEAALRWRAGRLADAGYPSREEALSWFARPPPAGAAEDAPGPPARPPGYWLAALSRGTLLDRAVGLLADDDRAAVEGQLVAAGNTVLVADGVDAGDPEAVRAAFEAARATLELGLGRLAPGGDEAAARVLVERPVKRIFQEGFLATLELRWRAERVLAQGGAGTREAPLLDAPLGEALSALVARRPRYFPGIELAREEWGSPAASAAAPRPFLSAAEVTRTAAALALCEGLSALARALGLTAPSEGPLSPRLSARYLTALANERLGHGFSPAPLAPAALPAAAQAVAAIDDARLSGEAGELLAALARARADELRQAVAAGAPAEQIGAVVVAPDP